MTDTASDRTAPEPLTAQQAIDAVIAYREAIGEAPAERYMATRYRDAMIVTDSTTTLTGSAHLVLGTEVQAYRRDRHADPDIYQLVARTIAHRRRSTPEGEPRHG